jgi:hypothetical protein
MRLLQVTMTGTAVPIIAKGVQPANSLPFQVLIFQNNAAHLIRLGDSTVSSTKGIVLASGSTTTQPPLVISPGLEYTSDAYEWYAYGTNADVLDVILLD